MKIRALFDRFFKVFNRYLQTTTDYFMVVADYFTSRVCRAQESCWAESSSQRSCSFSWYPLALCPKKIRGYVLATFMLPEAASLQRSAEVVTEVEEILKGFDAIENATTVAGLQCVDGNHSAQCGLYFYSIEGLGRSAGR